MPCISYLYISLNCFSVAPIIPSFSPKPVTNSPVQAATPITVMNSLCLYLNIFLAVTLLVKFNLFHIKVTLSSNITFPDFGGFGLIKEAGSSLSSSSVAATAATAVNNMAIKDACSARPLLNGANDLGIA